MGKILALVEGQTEESFIKRILQPHFFQLDIFITPIIIQTKRTKSGRKFKGGVPHYARVKKELMRLLSDSSAKAITTMIDYYALPNSFPGKNDQLFGEAALGKVSVLEQALSDDVNDERFIPYYSLHEFEALLFSSPKDIANTLVDISKESQLQAIRDAFTTPEEINDQSSTCPSARLQEIFQHYQKPLHGSLITMRTGLNTLRAECHHFNGWLEKLESI